jgi:isopentenyl phosphate kinase
MGTDVTLIKLGGSLITRKDEPDTPRPTVIARLARQLARAQRDGLHLVVGHGSGSFGHPVARRAGLVGIPLAVGPRTAQPVTARHAGGGSSTVSTVAEARRARPGLAAPDAIARVQRRAADLHRMVLDALVAAGAAPFSVPPSAVAVAQDGRLAHFHAGTVRTALDNGLMPVVYGDVVLDAVGGAAICSTESALGAVADALCAAGWRVRRCLWLGATPGVLMPDGAVLERVSLAEASLLQQAAGAAATTDVTGGMRHRVNAALALAHAGIPSWIGDGAAPDVLEQLLAGTTVPGTLVVP